MANIELLLSNSSEVLRNTVIQKIVMMHMNICKYATMV